MASLSPPSSQEGGYGFPSERPDSPSNERPSPNTPQFDEDDPTQLASWGSSEPDSENCSFEPPTVNPQACRYARRLPLDLRSSFNEHLSQPRTFSQTRESSGRDGLPSLLETDEKE